MITPSDIKTFLNQMDKDMDEANEMLRTEENLRKAVIEYQKAWNLDRSKDVIIRAELMTS